MSERTVDLGPHLISGVIDNSEKGKVTGELVINGLEKPLILNLQGNARPDLAGCVLKFKTPRSLPVEPEMLDLLEDEQFGCVGVITAAAKGKRFGDDGLELSNLLTIEWFNLAILIEFVIQVGGCKLEVDLPQWTLTKVEKEIQKKELEAARTVFQGMWEEFEEDLIEEEEYEQFHQIMELMMPELEAATSDEDRHTLMRKSLGPDYTDSELWEIIDVYFGPEDDEDLVFEHPDAETIPLDETLKVMGNRLNEASDVLLHQSGKVDAPFLIVEMATAILHSMHLMLHASSLLDPDSDKPQFEPYSILDQLAGESRMCDSVISYLEIEGTVKEKTLCDQVWEIRKMLGELIADLDKKKPEQPPIADDDEDIPF